MSLTWVSRAFIVKISEMAGAILVEGYVSNIINVIYLLNMGTKLFKFTTIWHSDLVLSIYVTYTRRWPLLFPLDLSIFGLLT